MGAFACLNFFDFFARSVGDVIHLDTITPCQTNQDGFVVGRAKHIGRHRACFDTPLDRLGGQVDSHQFIAVLHGGPDRGALAVNPHVARCFRRGNTLDQCWGLAIPLVDVDVIESIGHGYEPLHVGRKSQMVGVQNTWNHTLNFGGAGVYEGQRVGQGIGHNDRFLIGREVQMVRFFARWNALGFGPGHWVYDADIAFQRIQYKDGSRRLGSRHNRCGLRRSRHGKGHAESCQAEGQSQGANGHPLSVMGY